MRLVGIFDPSDRGIAGSNSSDGMDVRLLCR